MKYKVSGQKICIESEVNGNHSGNRTKFSFSGQCLYLEIFGGELHKLIDLRYPGLAPGVVTI